MAIDESARDERVFAVVYADGQLTHVPAFEISYTEQWVKFSNEKGIAVGGIPREYVKLVLDVPTLDRALELGAEYQAKAQAAAVEVNRDGIVLSS